MGNVATATATANASSNVIVQAARKLSKMYEENEKDPFAKLLMAHLWSVCKTKKGFAELVMQDHKTYKRLKNSIIEEAKKLLHNTDGPVEDRIVYNWAENYFMKDDKIEVEVEEQKARELAEKQKKIKEEQDAKEQKRLARAKKKAEKEQAEKAKAKAQEQQVENTHEQVKVEVQPEAAETPAAVNSSDQAQQMSIFDVMAV